MQALVVIDAQNEFSPEGDFPVPGHAEAVAAIARRVERARAEGIPIAWVRHHNRPDEPAGFQPGTWGAQFTPGFGPRPGVATEREFVKEVFGAFTGTDLASWLEERRVTDVVIVGFLTHMCVSTTAREALMLGLNVAVDPEATATEPIERPAIGALSAPDSHRAALLHLADMGVELSTVSTPGRPNLRAAGSA